MGIKRHRPEEIVIKLHQVEVLVGQGIARIDAIRADQHYRTDVLSLAPQQYEGMSKGQLKELKRLQKENERLRKAVSDLTLDKLILTEAAQGNF